MIKTAAPVIASVAKQSNLPVIASIAKQSSLPVIASIAKQSRYLYAGPAMLCLALTLAGCAGHKSPSVTTSVVSEENTVVDVDALRARYMAELQSQGVQVIHVGEQLRIVLRDDFIFNPNSANLLETSKPVLATVASLLRTYVTESVQVAAYSDKQDSPSDALALTTRQADVIAKQLWKLGVDTRVLTAVGLGQANPVDWNGSEKGQSHNRRVEIKFRYYPTMKGYE